MGVVPTSSLQPPVTLQLVSSFFVGNIHLDQSSPEYANENYPRHTLPQIRML
jgi:hypothetical protein